MTSRAGLLAVLVLLVGAPDAMAISPNAVFAGGTLTVPALRSTIMTIGGIEARHAAVLQVAARGASPLDVFPGERAFYPGDNPLADLDGAVLSS